MAMAVDDNYCYGLRRRWSSRSTRSRSKLTTSRPVSQKRRSRGRNVRAVSSFVVMVTMVGMIACCHTSFFSFLLPMTPSTSSGTYYVDAFSVPTILLSQSQPSHQRLLQRTNLILSKTDLQNHQNHHHKFQKLTPFMFPQSQQQKMQRNLPTNELHMYVSSSRPEFGGRTSLSSKRSNDSLLFRPPSSSSSLSSSLSIFRKLRRIRKRMMVIMMSTMIVSKIFPSSMTHNKLNYPLRLLRRRKKKENQKFLKKNFLSKSRAWIKRTALAMVLMVVLLLPSDSVWAAGSSGRMGGSIGSSGGSSRPSMSRPATKSPPPQIRNYSYRSRPPPIRVIHHHRPHHYYSSGGGSQHHYVQEKAVVTNPDGTTTIVRKQTTTTTSVPVPLSRAIPTVGLLVGVGVPVAYWLSKENDGDWGFDKDDNYEASPLGPGASAASLTVCLLVPKRGLAKSSTSNSEVDSINVNSNDKDILTVLEHLAETADTSTRKGLQNIIEEISVELLRQKDSIVSADSQYTHFKKKNRTSRNNDSTVQAERQYRQWSTIQRGKFERETMSNYDGNKKKLSTTATKNDNSDNANNNNNNKISGQSTVALVHITIAIEGNSLKNTFGGNNGDGHDDGGGGGGTKRRMITTRQDLVNALTQLSSDSQVEDCLLSAEVIWSPQDPDEQLTMDDIYADFPSLYTLL